MKKQILSLSGIAIFVFFIFAFSASAQIGMMGGYWPNTGSKQTEQSEELDKALQNIYDSQNITEQKNIDCSKISDGQFDEVGDAYMGIMLPNKKQHEVMDNMMGGEGSENLRQAHINMGRSYLGCWSNYESGPVYMPMMRTYGAGWDMMSGTYGNYGWFGIINMTLVWTIFILIVAALVKFIKRK